jgi:hypothetical protein
MEGVPFSTVKSRIFPARDRIRQQIRLYLEMHVAAHLSRQKLKVGVQDTGLVPKHGLLVSNNLRSGDAAAPTARVQHATGQTAFLPTL